MSSTGYVLGVDGGGTKTVCVCVSVATREVVGKAEEGSTNWNSVGSSTAKQNLLNSMQNALRQVNAPVTEGKSHHTTLTSSTRSMFRNEWSG
jgi:N-acetylglucosamine kinase-like BadF-type ATPase